MKLTHTQPISASVKSAVLLIFLPLKPSDRLLRDTMGVLVNSLQSQFDQAIGILKIDEMTYPEVVRSFKITRLPAFVLVSHGVELWRHEGAMDEATLIPIIQRLVVGN